jgi:hypothetical protein
MYVHIYLYVAKNYNEVKDWSNKTDVLHLQCRTLQNHIKRSFLTVTFHSTIRMMSSWGMR